MCWRTELFCPASLPTSSQPPPITGCFHAALDKLYTRTTCRRTLALAVSASGYKVSRQGHTFTTLHSSTSDLCSLPDEIRKRRQGTMGGLKSKSKGLVSVLQLLDKRHPRIQEVSSAYFLHHFDKKEEENSLQFYYLVSTLSYLSSQHCKVSRPGSMVLSVQIRNGRSETLRSLPGFTQQFQELDPKFSDSKFRILSNIVFSQQTGRALLLLSTAAQISLYLQVILQ